ncbi:histidinol-phosphate transaminase [Corynebacterium pacaense]|uniref:histidinol-phosphate transaminase n=1 Tax=Corynebacterium pacaense TaxID=1816684 RepID=UPI0009B9D772|nr:histidinol-phosphate transaminase [Corynebacterium pacaense]
MIRADLADIPTYIPGKRIDNAVKLSSNEASFPPLPAAIEAMGAAAATANRYPDMGAIRLREVLAEHLELGVDQVAVGCGSSALCQQLVQVTCAAGDEVIFAWRSFEAYPIFARVAGATAVAVPLRPDTQDHDLDAMADAITDRTRLIFICNPNNPSGTTITELQFHDFMARVPEDVVVALDEAYFEFNRAGDTPLATEEVHHYPNVIGLRTFSKAYGLAGVRVGYAFGNEEIISAMNKVAIPFAVSSVAQAGALASLDAGDQLLERLEETISERDRVAVALGADPSQANFVWLPGPGAQELAGRLAARGVVIRAFPEGARITVTTAAETDALLRAWEEIHVV